MNNKLNCIFNKTVCILLLISLVSCNMNLEELSKSSATDGAVRAAVSKCIEREIVKLKDCCDDEIDELLELYNDSPDDVVAKALTEDKGAQYLDFCYAADLTRETDDSSYIMLKAEGLMDNSDYRKLKRKVDEYEKGIKGWGKQVAKEIPVSQRDAFYKDLKALVVKTTVMLVAAFVYAAVPPTVVWGKISAAAALSIGAGLAADIIMTVYGRYRKIDVSLLDLKDGESYEDLTFEQWVSKLKESSVATYAIATAATSYLTSVGMNKVTGAIILTVFTLFNANEAIEDMKNTYNFDA